LLQGVVTAWEVTGKVDYNKLCDEFGCTPISASLVERVEQVTGVPAHPFLKRKIFYAHRDLEELLDLYEKGEKFYLYTGMHYASALLILFMATGAFIRLSRPLVACTSKLHARWEMLEMQVATASP
jgi:hypothetical protein